MGHQVVGSGLALAGQQRLQALLPRRFQEISALRQLQDVVQEQGAGRDGAVRLRAVEEVERVVLRRQPLQHRD
jgi:hypothetical protein